MDKFVDNRGVKMNEDLNELLNRAKELLKDEMSEVSHKTCI